MCDVFVICDVSDQLGHLVICCKKGMKYYPAHIGIVIRHEIRFPS